MAEFRCRPRHGRVGTAPHVVPVERGLPGHSVATPRVVRALGFLSRRNVAGPWMAGGD